MSFVIHPFIKKYAPFTVHTKRYSDAVRPNNVVRGVDFGERRAAPYNPSLERTRFHRYALLGIAILRMAQPREGVAHLALR